MMANLGRCLVALLAIFFVGGCAEESETSTEVEGTQVAERVDGYVFKPSPPDLLTQCLATARKVGYAVPCPQRAPTLTPTIAPGPTGCVIEVIGPGGVGGCSRSWRGWVVGSSDVADQHLVITASPRALTDATKVVNGPAWYPAARVRHVGSLRIKGWRVRAVYAPQATNAGSAFADHVVLIWTVDGHTYGVGFHNRRGIRETLRLTEALTRGLELVAP